MLVQIDFKMATDGVQSYQHRGFGILQGNTLRFIDHLGDRYEFDFQNPMTASMNRLGKSPLSMTFKKGIQSPAKFTQDGFTLFLDVITTDLIVEKNRLDIVYHITDGESIFSKHHLMMDWNDQRKE